MLCFEHVLLVLILSGTFFVGVAFAHWGLDLTWDMCWGWAFSHLFDFDVARKSVAVGKGFEKLVAFILYCTTWMIGGGTLLAALVLRGSAFFARVRNGELRYTWCLRKHYVILGWDYNVVSLLRQLLRDGILNGRTLVILSDISPVEIRRTIREALGANWLGRFPFRLLIYRGVYDSVSEFDKLALKYSDKIYITGMQHERAHDVRLLVLLAQMDNYLSKCSANTNIVARVDSYSLFRSLVMAVKKGPNKLRYLGNRVRFVNFHENWSRCFWNIDTAKSPHVTNRLAREYPPLKFRQGNDPVRLVIVGFGSMGQAMLVQALRQSTAMAKSMNQQNGCANSDVTKVTIIDPSADEAYDRFMQNYSDIVSGEYANYCQVDEKINVSVSSRKFLEKIAQIASRKEQVTVVVTLPDADMALDASIMIQRVTRSAVNVLMRANVYESDLEDCRANLSESYQLKNLYLFGFKDGAGYKR